MSGIGELAYTLLLGWMRALVDWFWSMFSGTGNTGAWQWFLSNWKIWLIVLLVGGVVVDWLMWVVRWRPYRLLFRNRAPAAGDAQAAYDGDAGYYDQDTIEAEAADWTDTPGEWTDTYATLSEIDPDWAEGFVMDAEAEPLYDPDYDPMHPPQYVPPYIPPIQAVNRWAPPDEDAVTPDEQAFPDDSASEEAYEAEVPDEAEPDGNDDTGSMAEAIEPDEAFDEAEFDEYEPTAADTAADEIQLEDTELNKYSEPFDTNEIETTVDQNTAPYVPGTHRRRRSEPAPAEKAPASFDPFAPYDAYDPDEAAAYADRSGDAKAPAEDDGPLMYGRPTMWPGMHYGVMGNATGDASDASASQDAASKASADEAYDPLFNPTATPTEASAPRRRRRRLHEHVEADPPREEPAPQGRSRRREDTVHFYYEDDDPAPRGKAAPMPSWVDPEPAPAQRRQPQDTRPSRLVRPQAAEAPAKEPKRRWGRKRKEDLQTVTGKPAKPRGLRRFTSTQEDPIAGLPPLDLTDPFLPAVRPNPDFAPDDGEEYYDD